MDALCRALDSPACPLPVLCLRELQAVPQQLRALEGKAATARPGLLSWAG